MGSDKTLATRCPMCTSTGLDVVDVRHAVFRHQDFGTIGDSIRLAECATCRLVFQIGIEERKQSLSNQFKHSDYAGSRQTAQTLKVKEFPQPVTRCFLQADILAGVVTRSDPRILDIGCFDGELLKELDRRYAAAELHGFDINAHMQAVFPREPNFHFHTDLQKLAGSFDLICSSHSLVYIEDLRGLMGEIHRLLKTDGMFYVQTTDFSVNPYALLLADQHYYFTGDSLAGFVSQFGFDFTPVTRDWFPRDAAGMARQIVSGARAGAPAGDASLRKTIAFLDDVAQRVSRVSGSGRLGVLGTTMNAAFVDSVVGARLDFFADENPAKVGTKFRSKPVLTPAALGPTDTLILPYGTVNRGIQQRFAAQYVVPTVCV